MCPPEHFWMMAPDSVGRRRLLAALAATSLAGCSTDGAGDVLTATPQGSEGAGTPTEPTARDGATATQPPTETSTKAGTESPTSTRTASPTPQVAQVPPPNALDVVGVDVTVERGEAYAYAESTVELANRGAVTFTLLELRVDVFYQSRTQERTHVVSGYARERFSDGFEPGETVSLSPPRRQMRYVPDGRAEKQTGSTGFSAEVAYREVHYR